MEVVFALGHDNVHFKVFQTDRAHVSICPAFLIHLELFKHK